jgi:hypothetical protein
MDVAPAYISFLDLIFSVRRVALPVPDNPGSPKIVRRVMAVEEVESATKHAQVFAWDPTKDKFIDSLERSVKLRKLAKDYGKTMKDIVDEIANRILVLQWLRSRNIRNYIEISTVFSQYHNDPQGMIARIKADLVVRPAFEDQKKEVIVQPPREGFA